MGSIAWWVTVQRLWPTRISEGFYYLQQVRTTLELIYKEVLRLGAVAQACNPSTLGDRGGWITRSRDGDHPGQQDETPSLLKIQKLAGRGGACL